MPSDQKIQEAADGCTHVSYEQLRKGQAKVGSHQVMTLSLMCVQLTSFLGWRHGHTSVAWTGFSSLRTLRIRSTTLAPLQIVSRLPAAVHCVEPALGCGCYMHPNHPNSCRLHTT